MRRKDEERETARRLRAEGWSIKRIAKEVGVAVSSVSVWVRDVEFPRASPRTADAPPTESAPDPVAAADGRRRRCSRCRQDLPLSAFNRNKDGHQHNCRECFRAYFRERGGRHVEQVRAARDDRRSVARRFLGEYLAAHPCVDCGEQEVFVLEFDHCRGEKARNVADLLAAAAKLDRIRREVECCDVVCVNCHRRRTASRGGWYRATGVFPASWDTYQRRNNAYLVDVLRSRGCVDCGERDPVVLECDHIGEKRGLVPRMALASSLERLQAEIDQCEIRCANCHRLRTLSGAPCWRESDHWAEGLFHAE